MIKKSLNIPLTVYTHANSYSTTAQGVRLYRPLLLWNIKCGNLRSLEQQTKALTNANKYVLIIRQCDKTKVRTKRIWAQRYNIFSNYTNNHIYFFQKQSFSYILCVKS